MLLAVLALACAHPLPAQAQDDELERGFKRLSAEQEERFKAVLATPTPAAATEDELRKIYRDKQAAAMALGSHDAREAVLREAVVRSKFASYKNNLAALLLDRGQLDEGNAMRRAAVVSAVGTDPFNATVIQSNVGCDMVTQNQLDAARSAIAESVRMQAAAFPEAIQRGQRRSVLRAGQHNSLCLARLEPRQGRLSPAMAAAVEAEKQARRALEITPPEVGLDYRFVTGEIAVSLALQVRLYREAYRLPEAERALAELVRLSREVLLAPTLLSTIYSLAANLRYTQREFAQSEAYARKADAVLEGLGYSPIDSLRAERADVLAVALAGQKKWAEAQAVFDRLDQLAGSDVRLKRKVYFGFDRAWVLLHGPRFAQAATLYANAAANNAKTLGETHYYTAQAQGLQGVALWRRGTAQTKAQALPLLKAAVQTMMLPANAEYLENWGYLRDMREAIFAVYLEAVTTTAGEDPMQALAPADWVRGGAVQDALSDSAVRAAATTPALAALVRSEQDAKNEIKALRSYLSGEADDAASPLPGVAEQMRARINALEAQRTRWQAQIKAQFPGYERLVRPAPPGVAEVAAQLDARQALVVLLPTADATYVWAVAADKPASFSRVPLPEREVRALVLRLRRDLDIGALGAAPTRFDTEAAHALYRELLEPLRATWGGKPQLIVAAGGALAQLPFAVLHTRSGGAAGAAAPWLIAQVSIAQVPSVAAWIAIKNAAKIKPASQALMGWGDPAFAQASNPAAAPLRTSGAGAGADIAPTAARLPAIPPLPETRDELMEIAKALQANPERDLLLGARATRQSVLQANGSGVLAQRRVLVFATHGLVPGDLPDLTQPALALAAGPGSNPLDSLLTLEDVLTLQLNADWVVLSACNTASADGRGEEALSGLARGFFYAGSRSLLVTHWAVESESAKRLTTSTFAHQAANPGAAKAESLRQAMLGLMAVSAYAHPAYWAPYALVGDGGH